MTAAQIRPAQQRDIETLVQLARDSFREAYEDTDDAQEIDDYVRTHFTPTIFEGLLTDEDSSLMLVEDDGRAIGYVHTRLGEAPEGIDGGHPMELARIYLRRGAVGRGVGSLMMTWVLGEAERRRCDVVWLQVYELNERAIAFYRRHGFSDAGTRAFEFGGRIYNDPLMSRRL